MTPPSNKPARIRKAAAVPQAPRAERPHMPDYGIAIGTKGLLPWRWAEEKLTATRIYWLTTVTPKDEPHVMPIWGIWVENRFYFSTRATSVKARNLAANPRCVIANGDPDQAVILHGEVRPIAPQARIKQLSKPYAKKYGIGLTADMGILFELSPTHAFGQPHDQYAQAATRWRF